MTPGSWDPIIYQGATFKPVVRLASATAAIDLTGATARMQIRQSIDDADPVITLNESNGRAVITDAVNGEISLFISDEDTAALTFSRGVYDLEVEYSDGSVDRVLSGKVKLSKEVTR